MCDLNYYYYVAIPSMQSAYENTPEDHMQQWYEQGASMLGSNYIKQNNPDFYDKYVMANLIIKIAIYHNDY